MNKNGVFMKNNEKNGAKEDVIIIMVQQTHRVFLEQVIQICLVGNQLMHINLHIRYYLKKEDIEH